MFQLILFNQSLNKIPNDQRFMPIRFEGNNITSKFNYLKSLLGTSTPKMRALSILFQHIDLSLFTRPELENFLEIPRLEIVTQSLSVVNTVKVFPDKRDLFDTGSGSIYLELDYQLISDSFYKEAFSLYKIHTGIDFKSLLRGMAL